MNPQRFAKLGCYQIKAFTLAETLITLAIIGIIAALVVPNLLRNYKAAQLRSQFFAANAYIKQATYKLAQSDKETNLLTSAELFDYIEGTTNYKTKNLPNLYNSPTYYNYNRSYSVGWETATHMTASFDLPKNMTGYILESNYTSHKRIAIDINGIKNKPNRYGHDVFSWGIDPFTKIVVLSGNTNEPSPMPNEYVSYAYFCKDYNTKGSRAGEDGIGCGINALTNKDYFKKLPK